jgi:serine/threonine-protein kinase
VSSGKREAQSFDRHPLLGQTLRGTYRIERLLDHGGMGLVFEAEHVRLKRHLAVKVLPHHLVRDAYALSRFRREAEIVALLQHPHVVQVIDFDTTERQEPYLVMELLAGEHLAARLERERRLPLATVVRIATQVASALAAVHRAGIVHRDLKPGNVFLTEMPGQGLWVKLLDFGISKGSHAGKGLTGEHDVMGTPEYMSPEQALGRAANADQRSDQYSLAVIVYQMLSGRVPFVGRTEIEILSQVIADQAPTLKLMMPDLPERVSSVVRRAMSKLPDERFENAEAFAAALSQAAGLALPPVVLAGAATLRLTSDPTALSPQEGLREAQPNTGLRARTPRRRGSTISGPPSLDKLHALLGRVERAYAGGSLEQAAKLVEAAFATAERMPEAATKVPLAQTSELFSEVLEARLGGLRRRFRAAKPTAGDARDLSPSEAFLLSNADGQFTVEELIDFVPLPRIQTLRLMTRLLRGGYLT